MYELTYQGPSGRVWPLMSRDAIGLFVEEGSMEDGFTGGPGQQVTGTLRCTIRDHAGVPADKRWREFRRDWSRHAEGVLHLKRNNVALRLPCRASAVPPGPRMNPGEVPVMRAHVPVSSREGVEAWLEARSQAGSSVPVTNSGDTFVWPKIWWQGAGGNVTLPSGAIFTLPPTDEPRIIMLNPDESAAVVDERDRLDDPLWRLIRGAVFGEGVPVGEERTYGLPDGAELAWDLGHYDPWR
ncbi:hypothetical protein NYP18_09225 [Corynebacterium sp. YIM 101645]|uniref:Minor tail protein n=1 Tax=Corynebacterium lemuris TaxID=1859292 RepID=A0ABT2FYI4_9CORY|nr:hypothetical protein [Corynebacterium lemuris]MCS5479840.1 hypothetical protein [Corynebacterium lemuris]